LGSVDELLAAHKTVIGPRTQGASIDGVDSVVRASTTERQTTMLVRTSGLIGDPAWTVHDVGLEELVLAYLAEPAAGTLPGPREVAS